MSEPENELNCPVDCPNRKKDGNLKRGKWGAYYFALLLSVLVLAFSFEERDGNWRPKPDPPVGTWAILLPAIGLCLGVQIDAASLGKFLGK